MMEDDEEDFFDEEDELEKLIYRFEKAYIYNESDVNCYFDKDEYYEIIDYYIVSKQFDFAYFAIMKAQNAYPEDTGILFYKAKMHAHNNKSFEALKVLRLIEKQMFDEPVFYILKANIYSNIGLHNEAIALYKTITEISEDKHQVYEAYNAIAQEYLIQNHFIESIEYFKKSIALSPQNNPAISKIYVPFSELNKLDDFIEYFQQLTDVAPFNSDVWFYLSKAYYDTNDFEKALDSIEYALAIRPDDPNFVQKKSDILIQLKRPFEALELLKEKFNQNKEYIDYTFSIAEIYNIVGNHEKAIEYLHQYIHYLPTDAKAWLEMAHSYIQLSSDTQALSCIQQSILNSKFDNNQFNIHFQAAKLYILMDYYEEALNLLKDLYEQDYINTPLIMWLSIAYEKCGYATDAVNLLTEHIYKFNNTDAELLYCLSAILLLYQYRNEGMNLLEQALKINPELYPVIYLINTYFEDDPDIQHLIQEHIQ